MVVSVSQLNRYIKAVLEEDGKLSGIYIQGEIVNFKRHFGSGHCYFTLKDATSSIRAVLFQSHAARLNFEPENGMAVLACGSVGVFERDGAYQLYVTDLQPDGAGALAVAFEQRKKKLDAEGLFDQRHKRPLPAYPSRIGVITSRSGAALSDITSVLERRYPMAVVVHRPALVQGAEAAGSLIEAVEQLDRTGRCDVIILGRGGGSSEDLWCFNDEALARTVFAASTPIVSAVGHETDYTICDFVADMRAPTPSAAAELVVPDMQDLARQVARSKNYLAAAADRLLHTAAQRVAQRQQHPALASPWGYYEKNVEKLDFLVGALYNRKRMFLQTLTRPLEAKVQLLNSLSPLEVLSRGYCVAYYDEKPVVSAEQLEPGQQVELRLRDGVAQTVVQAVEIGGKGKKGND